MKKFLIIAAISLAALHSNAQTEAGKILLGGNVSLDLHKEGDMKYTIISALPSAGYFISDNLALGTGIGLSYNKSNQPIVDVNGNTVNRIIRKEQAFVFNPFLRKYGNISEQFKYFGQLSVPLSFGNTKGNSDNYTIPEHKINSFYTLGLSLAPGIVFFPSKNFGLEFSVDGLGYGYQKTKPVDGTSVSTKDFSFSTNFFTPKVGVQFYF